MRRLMIAAACLGVMAFVAPAAAADITVLSANGMREVMDDLGPKFERAGGRKVTVAFATLGVILQRIQGGEAADVVTLPRQGIDRLVRDGHARSDTVVVLARSGIGIAIRKGAPKPDISSPEALRRTLLAAKSVTVLDPAAGGTSGVHFATVLDRLGIAADMKPKLVFHANARAAGVQVAGGEAELAVNLVQELLPLPGIDVAGPLPGDLQNTLVFAAAITAAAKDPAAAKALIEFLHTSEAKTVIRSKGMETD